MVTTISLSNVKSMALQALQWWAHEDVVNSYSELSRVLEPSIVPIPN